MTRRNSHNNRRFIQIVVMDLCIVVVDLSIRWGSINQLLTSVPGVTASTRHGFSGSRVPPAGYEPRAWPSDPPGIWLRWVNPRRTSEWRSPGRPVLGVTNVSNLYSHINYNYHYYLFLHLFTILLTYLYIRQYASSNILTRVVQKHPLL